MRGGFRLAGVLRLVFSARVDGCAEFYQPMMPISCTPPNSSTLVSQSGFFGHSSGHVCVCVCISVYADSYRFENSFEVVLREKVEILRVSDLLELGSHESLRVIRLLHEQFREDAF